jgi:DNA polymerase-3 subunit beta
VKITIKRESFSQAFQLAAAVAPARSPKPILQNVKLEVRDGQTTILATDQEQGVRLTVGDVEIQSEGAAVIPVSRLGMILREVTDETLRIDTTAEKTIILGQRSRFELGGQNPDEFPEVATFDATDYFEVAASVLRELIRRTLFATDAESSRYALGGVLLEPDTEMLTAVGTDGRRMAKMEGAIHRVGNPQAPAATIVPARAMQLIERMLPADETMVQLAPRANDLLLREPRGVFYTRLVEGRFPKWREVLPKRHDSHKIDIPVGPLHANLRQAAIVASEESRGVDFCFKEGTLVLSAVTAEVGEARVEMPVPYTGEELTISLDHRYVSDFLKVLQPDKIFTLDVANGEQAAYCTTDDRYGYVIMPLSRERR